MKAMTRPSPLRHWQIGVILLLFLVTATIYSLYLPLGEASDETDHFALVRFIVETGRPPLTQAERQSIGPKGDASPIYHSLVAILTQHTDTSQLPALPYTQARPERLIPTDGFRSNRIFHTEDETFPFRGIVLAWHLARMVSVLFGTITVLVAYVTTLAICPCRRYSALAVAGFVAFLPRFVINSAVVTDDSLAVCLISLAVYCMVRLAQGDYRPHVLILSGALVGGSALVKNYGLLLLPEMALLFLVLAWRENWGWPTLLRRCGYCIIAFLLVAGWWFVFLEVMFNQVADLGMVRGLLAPLGDPVVTTGVGRALDLQPGDIPETGLDWAAWASLFYRSFWVTYAWLNLFATPLVYKVLGVFLLLASLGLANSLWKFISSYLRWRHQPANGLASTNRPSWRLDVTLLAAHMLLFIGVIGIRYLLKPAEETAQGRHLYPALIATAFFCVSGLVGFGQLLADWLGPQIERLTTTWKARQEFIDLGVAVVVTGGLLSLSILSLPLFIIPAYQPLLPIRAVHPSDVFMPHSLSVSFADGLDLIGYDWTDGSIESGDELLVTLYWYAGASQNRDYLIRLCLYDKSALPVVCRDRHPVDGRYPMRAWEKGYVIRDEVALPTPYCLKPDDYDVTLSVLPLRKDTAGTTLDETAEKDMVDHLVGLGTVSVKSTLIGAPHLPANSFDIWIGDNKLESGKVELDQIRQNLVLMNYQPADMNANGAQGMAYFGQVEDAGLRTRSWLPVEPGIVYQCPDGGQVSTENFIVDPSVVPGVYRLVINDSVQNKWSFDVQTRARSFSRPSDIPNQVDALYGDDLILLGYNLNRSARWPGDTIEVAALWQSQRIISHHYLVSLYLVDRTFGEVAGKADLTLGAHYPSMLWAPGEHVKDTYALMVDLQALPGIYDMEMTIYDLESGELQFLPIYLAARAGASSQEQIERLSLGQIRIKDKAETETASSPMKVYVGDQIMLLGYDISSTRLETGQTLHLILHWQADSQPITDYTVFTQLIGPDGLVWAQKDNQPQGSRYPTTRWNLHSQVIDRYDLKLSGDVPAGKYRLIVGMYDLQTGQRLPALDSHGKHLPDDSIFLTSINVE